MTQIFDSLGWALLHSLWQGGLAMLAVIAFRGLTKNATPSLRYNFQIFCLFGCFFAFLITFGLYLSGGEAPAAIKSLSATETVSQAAALFTGTADGLQVTSQSLSISAAASAPLLGILWCLGFIFMAVRYLAAYVITQKLRHRGLSEVSVFWQRRFRTLVLNTGVSEKVRIFISDHVSGPLTIGFVKPIVLVPVGFLTGLPHDQVEAILLHELAHIRRYDYLVNLFQTAIKTVLFFHPAIHYISKKIDIDREQACDDLAVAQSRDPHALVRGLAALRLHTPGQGFGMAADGGETPLMDRLKRLVGSVEHQRRPEHLLMPLIATLLIGGIYLSTTSVANAHPEPKDYTHADADKENYKFKTKRLNGRDVTVKITEDGRRWVLADGTWTDIDKNPAVINRLPKAMPQPPQPPKAPKYKNGQYDASAFEAKMKQFEIDMEYFEADLERYFDENDHLSEREQEQIQRQVEREADRAEREAERMEERIEREIERAEEQRERQEERAERQREWAEEQSERAQEQRERAAEQKERAWEQKQHTKEQLRRAAEQRERAGEQRERAAKQRARDAEQRARDKEQAKRDHKMRHKADKQHAKYNDMRETLYGYLIKDGLIASREQKATLRYVDNNWTANGKAIPSYREEKYCRLFSDMGIKKSTLAKVEIKPGSTHIVSETKKGKHSHKITVGEFDHNNKTQHNISFDPEPPLPPVDPQPPIRKIKLDVNEFKPQFVWPTNSRYITAKFGQVGKIWETSHQGIDFKGATGEPVFASADGIVQLAASEVNWGKRIILKHANGYQSLYGHMDSLGVSRGQYVKAGDVIGTVGSTGKSTGPHLHFEIRKNGRHLDPAPFIN